MHTNRIKEYEEYLTQCKLSRNTMDVYMRCARNYESYFNQNGNLADIDQYVELLKSKYKIGTVNLYIIATNKYLKFKGETENQGKIVKTQHTRSLENIISLAEYNALMEYAKETGRSKYYLIMLTLAYTGIRISELRYFQVDFIGDGHISVTNKGKTREIYIPEHLVDKLQNYCKKNNIMEGAIFRGNSENSISRVAVWQMLQKFADMLGIPKEKVHPHSFRHFFAKCYINKYGNLSELADILGHSSLEITRIYTMTTIEEKRVKMNALLGD